MKKEKYPMRGVLKKYKISMEIPPEKRDAFIKNTQPSLIEILKQEKEWSIFLACTLGIFFFFKKIGWGISMKASSILFVILAATAAAASLSAGGYFVYSNINKPL
ncbi:MAG: hypothetical protein GY754_38410, partial [bacterium]|nr:hypothetical protein [bacterium]